MSDGKEQRIRVRAYHIWEREGRAGRAEDHWLEAESEVGRETEPPVAKRPEHSKKITKPRAAPAAKAKKAQANASEKAKDKPGASPSKNKPTPAAKPDAPRPRRTPPA